MKRMPQPMMKMIDLKPRGVTETETAMTGPAVCPCGHEWHVEDVPQGEFMLECPACGCYKGHMKYFGSPVDGVERWVCRCGSDLFYIRPTGVFCAVCATQHWPFD